jgi:excisionase family DNA binding protein
VAAPRSPRPTPLDWLTRRDAAEYARCSVSTIDRARRRGHLRAYGGGRHGPRFRRRDVDAWVGRGKPTEQGEDELF